MFQDGRLKTISSASCCFRSPERVNKQCSSVASQGQSQSRERKCPSQAQSCPSATHADRCQTQYKPLPRKETKSTASKNTGFKPFPFNDFRYYLTLFSKFFSSFPRGTCSLSVSRQYLALEGIYLLLWAAVPSNSTRWEPAVRCTVTRPHTGLSPYVVPCSKGLEPRNPAGNTSKDYNSPGSGIFIVGFSRFTRRY